MKYTLTLQTPGAESREIYVDELRALDFSDPCAVEVCRDGCRHSLLRSQDDVESFIHGLEIATAWEPRKGIEIATAWTPSKNNKDAAAEGKPTTHCVPSIAVLALGAAMADGESKYGKFNWRDSNVTASVFYNAMMRHLLDWNQGEDFATDSGIHHLAHLMAGCAIILDAISNDVFVDNRSKPEKGSVTRDMKNVWSNK